MSRIKEKRKPKRKPETEWCDFSDNVPSKNGKRPNHIRCPKCGRRLIPRTVDVEPYDPKPCLVYLIPPHKIPKTKRG